jgi:hypothetical protein
MHDILKTPSRYELLQGEEEGLSATASSSAWFNPQGWMDLMNMGLGFKV